MTVAFDTGAAGETESVVATVDISFTPGPGSDMVLVCFHWPVRNTTSSSSVTYDPGGVGAAFTSVASIAGPNDSSSAESHVWILKDTDIVKSTAKTIRGTASKTARQGIAVSSYTGVSQTTPTSSESTNEDKTFTNTTAISVASAAGDMVLGTCIQQGASITPTSPGVEWDASNLPMTTNTLYWNCAYWSGASSVDVQYDINSGTRDWSQIGFNLNQAAAAAPFLPYYDKRSDVLLRM